MATRRTRKPEDEPEAASVEAGALPAEALAGEFPELDLPVVPPLPPMEARSAAEIPRGPGWLYEPKWDGFRCLAFKSGGEVVLQSKSGQPLGRYFPELVEALGRLRAKRFVLDGEIVIREGAALSFDDLLQRIHPAESRIRKLAREHPATYMIFDLLVDAAGKPLVERPLETRRERLEAFVAKLDRSDRFDLSPATPERATAVRWMAELGAAGLDGVIAKRLDSPYLAGDRSAVVKVKRMRTADCVVGGFRWAKDGETVGSLLLGLYDERGLLDHVGFAASFSAEERKTLRPIVEPHVRPPGFTGKAPGGPSRWSRGRPTEWVPLAPVLVCEVRWDHWSGGRFRHGTKFLRWRPDKAPEQCTYEQVGQRGGKGIAALLG